MELTKKIGIGIVMIVPGFVFGGIVWALLGSWAAVAALEVVVALVYGWIISGRPQVA